MKKISGFLLIGLGVFHTMVGIVAGWPQIKAILNYGIWNALGQQPQNICMKDIACLQVNSIWWFISWGLMLILIGAICVWIELSLKRIVPAFIAWLLFIISGICTILIPVSGFWLVVAVAIYMLFCARYNGRVRRDD